MSLKVTAITATAGRHYCIERSIRFFLEQDYENCQQLIFQNSPVYQRLNTNIPEGKVILINNHIDLSTKQRYTTLGDIYRDAIKFVPADTDVVVFWDDDDIFLQNHISAGVGGLERGGKLAYKPEKSWFRSYSGITAANNTLEPSIFCRFSHIKQYGFPSTTSDQHCQWVVPLVEQGQIYVDPNGEKTLCYNWGDRFRTFKTSGNPNDPKNFDNYQINSTDHGDRIITPISKKEAEIKYYNLFENAH